jgi:phosphatidylglycerol:prolipoprotein diacylglycerol transferase
MFPILHIGPLAIQSAGFTLLFSFFIANILVMKFSKNLGTHAEAIENGLLYGIIAGILGARLGFMLKNPAVFLANPLNLISLTPSMLEAGFGLLTGILTIVVIAQKKHLPLWPTLDTLSPFFIIIFMGIHLANLANGNAYGIPTTLPWGIPLWNAIRHPVQLYGFILGGMLLVSLFFHTKFLKTTGFRHSGVLFSVTAIGISGTSLFISAFTAEKVLLGRFDGRQLIAFIVLLGALWLLYIRAYPGLKKTNAIISMGSNLNSKQNIVKGENLLAENFHIRRKSNIYRTEDVNQNPNTQAFLNRLFELETDLSYPDFVNRLKAIEKKLGREPGNKTRVAMDLDVLTFGADVFSSAEKQIPNPDVLKYRYLGKLLAEMAPDFRHPATGISIQEILEKMPDKSQITELSEVEDGIEG